MINTFCKCTSCWPPLIFKRKFTSTLSNINGTISRFIDGGKRYTPKSITLILHEMWNMVWCLWMIFYPHYIPSCMRSYNVCGMYSGENYQTVIWYNLKIHTVHTKRRAHILWPYLAAWELAEFFLEFMKNRIMQFE